MYAKNIWKNASPEKVTAIMDFNEGYKEYITKGKTERLCVDEALKLAKELGYKNAGLLLPLNTGVIAVSFSQFGYNIYNENIIGLGFSRNFGNKLKIGLKLDYLFFNFSGKYEDVKIPSPMEKFKARMDKFKKMSGSTPSEREPGQ